MNALFAAALLLLAASPALADTRSNLENALSGIEAVTGANVGSSAELCSGNPDCDAIVNGIQLRAAGSSLTLVPVEQAPSEFYLAACAGALSGLAGINAQEAVAEVSRAFQEAGTGTGAAKIEINEVELRVSPSTGRRTECAFWRR